MEVNKSTMGDADNSVNNSIKISEKNKKVIEWLIDKHNYEKTDKENEFERYEIGNIILNFEELSNGKDFDCKIDENGNAVFAISKGIREFKKYYTEADEVKKVLKELHEKHLSRLSELGYKDYFQEWIEKLFTDETMKTVAYRLAKGEINIDDYGMGRTKQIEELLTGGKRIDELEQKDYPDYQTFNLAKAELTDKKDRLVSLTREIQRDWRTVKERQSNGLSDYLGKKIDEVKKILSDNSKTPKDLISQLSQEYFNTLPKTTPLKLEDVEGSVGYWVEARQKEFLREAKSSWTLEEWKAYRPNEYYDPYSYNDRIYNEGRTGRLQLEKINRKRLSGYNRSYEDNEHNRFYQDIVNTAPESFESKFDGCLHCYEGNVKLGGKPFLKLLLKTKWRLYYICSRCENSEWFLDIQEWQGK